MEPRKRPRQQRSKRMVESILAAAAKILIEDGYESLSTGQVAKRAGVSIGSLYQYFPNKEAIIAELVRKLTIDATTAVSANMDGLADRPLEEAVRAMLTMVVGLVEQHGDLGRELLIAAQQMGVLPGIRMVEQRISEAGRRYLMRHRDEVRVQDIDQAIFVTFNAAVFVIFRSVFAPPGFMTRQQLIDELYRMIIGHLTRS